MDMEVVNNDVVLSGCQNSGRKGAKKAEKESSEEKLEIRLQEAKNAIKKMLLMNSQELSEPIRAIIGLINFLENKPKQADQQGIFSYLNTTSQSLDKIIYEINDCPTNSNFLN